MRKDRCGRRGRQGFGFSPEEHERQHALLVDGIDDVLQRAEEHLRRGECYDALRMLSDGQELIGQAKANQRAGSYSTGAAVAYRRERAAEILERIALCFAANCSVARRTYRTSRGRAANA